jgi:hypothetical protein
MRYLISVVLSFLLVMPLTSMDWTWEHQVFPGLEEEVKSCKEEPNSVHGFTSGDNGEDTQILYYLEALLEAKGVESYVALLFPIGSYQKSYLWVSCDELVRLYWRTSPSGEPLFGYIES